MATTLLCHFRWPARTGLLAISLTLACAADVAFQESGKITLPTVGERSVAARAESGDLYLFSVQTGTIHHVSSTGALINDIYVSKAPEGAQAQIFFNADITADRIGNAYISGIWRPAPRETASAVFVFGAKGEYVRTIRTEPVEPRHVAVDVGGNIYVVGLDPSYFRWKTDDCLLIHKFSPSGKRLADFSSCPGTELRTRGSASPGPSFGSLKREADLGSIWTDGNVVYHVLPASRVLRVFDALGKQVIETRIDLPSLERMRTQPADPTATEVTLISRLLLLGNGRLLVEWRHMEAAGNAQRATRFMTLHDRNGKAITGATYPVPRTSMLFSDATGNVYMLRALDSGVQELARGTVSVR